MLWRVAQSGWQESWARVQGGSVGAAMMVDAPMRMRVRIVVKCMMSVLNDFWE